MQLIRVHVEGNPLYESQEEAQWRMEATKRLPNLQKLDGEPVITDVETVVAAASGAATATAE